MGLSQLGTAAASSGSGVNATGLTVTTPNTFYKATGTFPAGVYSLVWTGGGTGEVEFWNGNTPLGSTKGSTGLNYNLASAATSVNFTSSVATTLNLTLISNIVSPVSGTLYTYTSTGTVNQVGQGYAILVAGGRGGDGSNGSSGAGGGASGGVIGGQVYSTGSMTVTIGAGGNGGTGGGSYGSANGGNSGGSTTFGNLTATSGGPGSGSPSSSAVSISQYFPNTGTTGGGGNGGGAFNGGGNINGTGSGIGTGGTAGATQNAYNAGGNGSAGTGYGAGGGAGGGGTGGYGAYYAGGNGGSGTAGVMYLVI